MRLTLMYNLTFTRKHSTQRGFFDETPNQGPLDHLILEDWRDVLDHPLVLNIKT